MILDLDFKSKEPELVAANNCFALVSQFSDLAFDSGNMKTLEATIKAVELLSKGFDALCQKLDEAKTSGRIM